jgi:hypothetical protein
MFEVGGAAPSAEAALAVQGRPARGVEVRCEIGRASCRERVLR